VESSSRDLAVTAATTEVIGGTAMLVLSRRPDERIVFPNLGISIQILRVSGKAVCVGIDAPREVRVLRDELADHQRHAPAAESQDLRELRHALRNRLNSANLALHVVRRQLELGRTADAEATIEKALGELSQLDRDVGQIGKRPQSPDESPRPSALLVEDDANESELLAGYLRMSGYEVHTVGNGREALQFLTVQRRPDVVLLDMRMPELDGPGTVSSIRQRPELQNLKVFAVSGTPRAELAVQLGPGGVDRWFSKPLDPARLVDIMNHDLELTRVSA
jgi:carbon storage regulator CsrA